MPESPFIHLKSRAVNSEFHDSDRKKDPITNHKWPSYRGGDTLVGRLSVFAHTKTLLHGDRFLKELSSSEKLELLSKITSEHQSLKARVQQLKQQRSLTSAEQIEISQLKKRKVLMKDRIEILQRN